MVNYADVPIQPFTSKRYQKDDFYKKRGVIFALELMQLYFNRLFDGEYIIEWPAHEKLNPDGHGKDYYCNYKDMEKMKTALHAFVMGCSSFETYTVKFSRTEKFREVKPVKPSQWSRRRRIKEICKSGSMFENQIIRQIFCAMPAPVATCFDYEYGDISAIYFTSEKIFHYLSFTHQKQDCIKKEFLSEHMKILECLIQISKPIPNQVRQYQISYLLKKFIIGFTLGGKSCETTQMTDIDLNFYAALYVLEKLLNLADRKFHFMDERGEVFDI